MKTTHFINICIKIRVTLTNPHLIRTPQPARVNPLQRRGNKIPVAGSVCGDSITGSAPRLERAEHFAFELCAYNVAVVAVVAAAAARRRVRDAYGRAETEVCCTNGTANGTALALLTIAAAVCLDRTVLKSARVNRRLWCIMVALMLLEWLLDDMIYDNGDAGRDFGTSFRDGPVSCSAVMWVGKTEDIGPPARPVWRIFSRRFFSVTRQFATLESVLHSTWWCWHLGSHLSIWGQNNDIQTYYSGVYVRQTVREVVQVVGMLGSWHCFVVAVAGRGGKGNRDGMQR